ncbi:phage tail protein [Iodobacter sp. CM08]|uniref:phage tail-collar fiber domain-containing protein n=1 Tax=Iodobacter sp. CM08 TaxID=3085902 RepID=UPI002980FFFE|nr:phage tail protein [Iodobacter sp. CM08]MDW5417442.1 phage tail protein [Iodobacter sp. CM08]
MSQQYFAILTTYGAAQIVEATAQKKTIHIETMAVGDGAGKDTVPNDKQTKLIKENYRSALNSLKSEAGKNTVIAELIIKENVGGWWIREMGLYDDKGGLIAVANCPASYKPQLAEGSGKVQTLRMVFVVSNTAAVTISVSQDIGIASIELVEETMKKHIADDDPHSKDYYNKKITDKTNAGLKKDLTAAAVKEGSRGRDEAKKYADDNKVALTGNQSIAGNKTFTGPKTAVENLNVAQEAILGYRLVIRRNQAPFAPYLHIANQDLTLDAVGAIVDGASREVGSLNNLACDTATGAERTASTTVCRIDNKGRVRLQTEVRDRDGKLGTSNLTSSALAVSVPISAPDPSPTADDLFKVSARWVNKKLQPYQKGMQSLPSTADLNEYNADGVWYQAGNAGAISGKNYPAPFAGVLEVFTAGSKITIQRYTLYNDARVFTRAAYNGTWNLNWALVTTDRQGVSYDAARLGGKLANTYTLKSEADERYPILTDVGGKGLSLTGCFNSSATGQISERANHDWIQGVFHNSNQPALLDDKTAWLTSINTQYSNGYSIMSKIGVYRAGFDYFGSMIFQHVGEASLPLGTWTMEAKGGAFTSKHLTLTRTAGNGDHSVIKFEKKDPSAASQILGAITWDTFRDVSAVSNVAAIWAEGAGEAANWGELHFGITTNGTGEMPPKIMSISDGRVLTSQLHTYYLKSRDPAGSIADPARDFDGVVHNLRWKNYGGGHVIFDASASQSPSGSAVNNRDAEMPWVNAQPAIMGWNGVNTFGVRVDSCRSADRLVDGSFGLPVGVPVPWPSNTPPSGWIFLQGQGINPAEAPVLASLYGATLPDLRGMYISGWDAGRGIDPGREVLSYQAANVGEHQHTVPFDDGGWLSYSGGGGQPGVNYVIARARATVDGPTGRTHPDNIAFNYIVRWG